MKSTYIIAEAGVNHNGSLPMAMQLIDAAINAGANAVKFQTFQASKLVTKSAPKADYQRTNTDQAESQYEMLKKLELSLEDHIELINHCNKNGIDFLSTPFDLESVDVLVHRLDLSKIKVSSGDVTNAPLLLKIASTGVSVILSTGMCTIGEVETALGILAYGYIMNRTLNQKPSVVEFQAAYASAKGQEALQKKVTLLHCTTEYPTPLTDVNLLVLDTLRNTFSLPVGYSDHTVGIAVSIAAAAMGAVIIEKHFTLDRTLPGPDHKASLEPDELKQLIQGIREVDVARGSFIKTPAPSEIGNRLIARKSIVASRDIKQGEILSENNLTIKRPSDGVSPIFYWDFIGNPSPRAYKMDEKVYL